MPSTDLYGIDPDALYPWSPKEAYFDANEEARNRATVLAMEATFEKKPQEYRDEVMKGVGLPEDMKLKDGAPVVLLGPLSERMSMQVNTMRNRQASMIAKARREAIEKALAGATPGETEEQRKARTAEIFDGMAAELVEKSEGIYTEEAMETVLKACIKGWQNLTRPGGKVIEFSGKPERDLACLPNAWKASIFWAVVTESAWSAEAIEGFGSRPD